MWSQMLQDAMKNTGASMTKTTAEVKRWRADIVSANKTVEVVSATDYATLQQRCEQLEECVRELCGQMFCTGYYCTEDCKTCDKRRNLRAKALALLGGEKGVGT